MKNKFLLFVLFLLAPFGLRAQQVVRFGQYEVVPDQNVLVQQTKRMRGVSGKSSLELGAPTNGKVNVLMQFAKIPDAKAQRMLARSGVKLEGYVGGNAYYAQVEPGKSPRDFARHNATSVMAMRPEWKVSHLLAEGRVPKWADRGGGLVEVAVSWFSNVNAEYVGGYVTQRGYRVLRSSDRLASMAVVMPLAEVQRLATEKSRTPTSLHGCMTVVVIHLWQNSPRRTAIPLFRTIWVRPYKPLIAREMWFGTASSTSIGMYWNSEVRGASYLLGSKGSIRTRRQDFIIIGSDSTTRR